MLCVGALFVVETTKLYLIKIQFLGGSEKVYKNKFLRRENAAKYFLFWAVCAIMTLVLG